MSVGVVDARERGLTVSAHWGRRQSHVRISGRLDGPAVSRAAELLLLSARYTRRLDLDLSAVDRLGPLGMLLLVDAQRVADASGCLMRLLAVSPAVAEVIDGTRWSATPDAVSAVAS